MAVVPRDRGAGEREVVGDDGDAGEDQPTKNTTTAATSTSDGTTEDHPPLVAYREHDAAGIRLSSGEPSTTDLLAALDAEADEEHEDEPLES